MPITLYQLEYVLLEIKFSETVHHHLTYIYLSLKRVLCNTYSYLDITKISNHNWNENIYLTYQNSPSSSSCYTQWLDTSRGSRFFPCRLFYPFFMLHTHLSPSLSFSQKFASIKFLIEWDTKYKMRITARASSYSRRCNFLLVPILSWYEAWAEIKWAALNNSYISWYCLYHKEICPNILDYLFIHFLRLVNFRM